MSYANLLFYSSLTSAIVLGLITYIKYDKCISSIIKNSFRLKHILIGLTNPFFYYIVLFKAYELLPAQEAQPLNFLWPIMISLFSAIFFKHKLQFKTIAGLLISFLGVVVIATHGNLLNLSFHNPFGVILAAGSSIIWATYWILNLKDSHPAHYKLFGGFIYGTVFSLIYVLFFDSITIPDIHYLAGAIYIGFFEMGITFFVWMRGLELSTDKAKSSTLAYLAPFVSLFFIALILNERIMLSSIIGLILIISGILFQNLGLVKGFLGLEPKTVSRQE
jgi:drug/metabolite transporter (DMT)-like permease